MHIHDRPVKKKRTAFRPDRQRCETRNLARLEAVSRVDSRVDIKEVSKWHSRPLTDSRQGPSHTKPNILRQKRPRRAKPKPSIDICGIHGLLPNLCVGDVLQAELAQVVRVFVLHVLT